MMKMIFLVICFRVDHLCLGFGFMKKQGVGTSSRVQASFVWMKLRRCQTFYFEQNTTCQHEATAAREIGAKCCMQG